MANKGYYKINVSAYSSPANVFLVVEGGKIVEAITKEKYVDGINSLERITKKEMDRVKKENEEEVKSREALSASSRNH